MKKVKRVSLATTLTAGLPPLDLYLELIYIWNFTLVGFLLRTRMGESSDPIKGSNSTTVTKNRMLLTYLIFYKNTYLLSLRIPQH